MEVVEPRRVTARLWWVFLTLGLGAMAAYFLVPAADHQVWYRGIGVAGVVATVVGIRLHRPPGRAGWYLVAAANACFVAGDEVLDAVTTADGAAPPLADVLYLSGYPLLIAAVLLLARTAGIAASREHRIDAAVITVGALAASWEPLVGSTVGDSGATLVDRIVSAAYPVLDLGVLFIVASAVVSARRSTPPQRLVALAIGFLLVADIVYAFATRDGTYSDGDPVDGAWLLSYVLFGAAALHPGVAAGPPVPDHTDHLHPRRWVAVVSVAAFVPLALLMAHAVSVRDLGFAVPVGLCAATFAFVGVRTVLLFGRVRTQTRELADRAASLRAALATEKALEADLRHRAYHDDLTGLPNRAWIRDRLEETLAAGRAAFCLADLDRFKAVNDTLGHRLGDQVLVAVARRVQDPPVPGMVVARLGGDEFACVLPDADPSAVAHAAQWLVDVLREPVEVDGHRIQLSCSVGVAHGEHSVTGADLMAQADVAMYAAKAAGRDRWRSYEPTMGAKLAEQLTITNAFADGLRLGQFSVVLQPVFVIDGGGLKGFEALVRWAHPSLGHVSPGRFVPLAEETGFVVPLGRWVLQTACAAASRWPAGPTVAVNVSARQLADPDLVADVAAALDDSGLHPGRLVLEVTESAIMDDVEQSGSTLAALKALGVVLAIDDFGTGHSSLAHLRDLPVDVLKIDRSFVTPLGDRSARASAYVQAIVGLARALGMTTVAEGVESPAQYEVVRELGCDTVQGYLTGRPLTPAAAARLADAGTVTPARR